MDVLVVLVVTTEVHGCQVVLQLKYMVVLVVTTEVHGWQVVVTTCVQQPQGCYSHVNCQQPCYNLV